MVFNLCSGRRSFQVRIESWLAIWWLGSGTLWRKQMVNLRHFFGTKKNRGIVLSMHLNVFPTDWYWLRSNVSLNPKKIQNILEWESDKN